MTNQLLTVKETCQTLRIGRTKLYQLINQGRLKSFKMEGSKKRLFKRESIEAFIQEQE